MTGFPKNQNDILNHIKHQKSQGLFVSKDLSSLLEEQMNHYLSEGLPLKKTEGWQYFPIQSINKDYCFDEYLESQNLESPKPTLEESLLISVKNGKVQCAKNTEGLSCFSWKDFLSNKISLDENTKNKIHEFFRKKRNSFCALNNILSFDGFILVIDKSLTTPIEIQYLQDLDKKMKGLNLRVFIFIKENVEAKILETFYGNKFTDSNQFFFNLQTDCFLENGSQLDFFHLDHGNKNDLQMNQFFANLESKSSINKLTLNFGSGISRYFNEISQKEHSSSDLRGLTILGGNKHSDHKVSVIHKEEQSSSNQLYQSLLFEKAKNIFIGSIDIKQKAQKSSAKQLSRNILFSDKAFAVTCPNLEVEADDVTAEHGATVSSLQEQQDLLFYLQSRGVSKQDSYQLILSGLVNEIVSFADDKIALQFQNLIKDCLKSLQYQKGEI